MSEKVYEVLNLLDFLTEEEQELCLREMNNRVQKNKEQISSKLVKAAKVTPEEVWDKLTSGFLKNENDRIYYYFRQCLERGEILSDLGEVEFDIENIEMECKSSHTKAKEYIGPRMFGNIAGVGCQAGGDWEWPVFFIIYLGEDGILHGYFPKEGNMYNHKNNAAFGNDDDSDEEFLLEWLKQNRPELEIEGVSPSDSDGELMFDGEKILKDISENVLLAD